MTTHLITLSDCDTMGDGGRTTTQEGYPQRHCPA